MHQSWQYQFTKLIKTWPQGMYKKLVRQLEAIEFKTVFSNPKLLPLLHISEK